MQLSIGQQLHKDALHCMFAFLSLTELPAAMRSCRAWYEAVRTLPLRYDSLCVSGARFYQLLSSSSSTPLARHIVSCDMREKCTASDLARLVERMPRLRSLAHSICRSTDHPPLYSRQLRELKVDLAIESDYGTILVQMENLSFAAGLRSLTLTLPECVRHIGSFTLEPLESLLQLESLSLINPTYLAPEELVHIRRLPFLRTLSMDYFDDEQADMLLEERADCPSLQLHSFVDGDRLDLKRAKLLTRMATLQRVEPWAITPDALRLIAHGLPDLHTLAVWVSGVTPESGWAVVRDGLAACRQLTSLTLESTPQEELTALLLALPPSVRKLRILHCSDFLRSDAFFTCVAEGGLCQLQTLRVQLECNEEDEDNSAFMVPVIASWLTRQRACAPWIHTVISP
jgi:hypothetical protein